MNTFKIFPDWKSCPTCETILILPQYKDDDYYFYCYICSEWLNWRQGTCLQKSKLKYNNLERLLFLFLDNQSISGAVSVFKNSLFGSKLSRNTVKKYFSLFTNITYYYYTQQLNCTMLCGDVEIDESLIFKPKKTRARRVRPYGHPSMWLMGMIERHTKKFIVVPVETRDDPTLMNIIFNYINCNSTVYSDCHSVYVNNRVFTKESRIIDYGYNHQFVDHSKEFVAYDFDHIHTNTIERLWGSIKADLRAKKIKKGYMKAIARFYFHKTLSKDHQLKFIVNYINHS